MVPTADIIARAAMLNFQISMNGATASLKKSKFVRLTNENHLNAPFKDKERVNRPLWHRLSAQFSPKILRRIRADSAASIQEGSNALLRFGRVKNQCCEQSFDAHRLT